MTNLSIYVKEVLNRDNQSVAMSAKHGLSGIASDEGLGR